MLHYECCDFVWSIALVVIIKVPFLELNVGMSELKLPTYRCFAIDSTIPNLLRNDCVIYSPRTQHSKPFQITGILKYFVIHLCRKFQNATIVYVYVQKKL